MMTGFIVFGVAVLVVLATSLIKNVDMGDKAKNLIATVLSVVGGVATVLGTNGWDFSGFEGGDVLGTVLIVYGASQLLYNFILKGTQVEAKLEDVNVLPGGGA
jgi:cellobiose-specific phosphotransferase system component IIC